MAESQLQVGAQDERDKSRARINRRIKYLDGALDPPPNADDRIDELRQHLDYLDGRTKRYDRAAGGLGRKTKGKG